MKNQVLQSYLSKVKANCDVAGGELDKTETELGLVDWQYVCTALHFVREAETVCNMIAKALEDMLQLRRTDSHTKH